MSNNNRTNINESEDGLGWIDDIKLTMSFSDMVNGDKFRIIDVTDFGIACIGYVSEERGFSHSEFLGSTFIYIGRIDTDEIDEVFSSYVYEDYGYSGDDNIENTLFSSDDGSYNMWLPISEFTIVKVEDINESEDDLSWMDDISNEYPKLDLNSHIGDFIKVEIDGKYNGDNIHYEINRIEGGVFYIKTEHDQEYSYPMDEAEEIFSDSNDDLYWRFIFVDDEINNLYGLNSIFGKNINELNIMESAGISFESRKWADIVNSELRGNPQEKTRLIIDGYDYPEAYEGFPIDYVVIDYYDKLTGYGQEHSGYDKDGNYIVLLYIQPALVDGKANYDLKSALNHEFKHAWDDYNRLSKGRPSIDNTKESKELYNKDFIQLLSNQQITGPIKDLLKYHYYLSNLERTAYLENVYDGNPTYERMVREIIRKDFESMKDRFDLDVNWHLINTAYDIPFLKRFKSPRDFIDHSAKDLTMKAQKMLKKINKMKYVHGLR